jgi:hypothetical protein
LDGTEYEAITGKVFGTVRYEGPIIPTAPAPTAIETDLTLLTLDVLSNRPNYPTFVDFNFYNQNEVLRSNSTAFFCWTEVRLTAIRPDLTTAFGRKGSFESAAAEKVPILGIADTAGPVTLIGIIETREVLAATPTLVIRDYSYSMYNDNTPVPTTFVPNP